MKSFFRLMLVAVSTVAFCACSDDDDPKVLPPMTVETGGILVLNQGNYGQQIEGSLTLIDYLANDATQNVFQRANGRSLGATPQGALVYGRKLYIAVYESNTIEVVNIDTFKSEKCISLTGAEGQNPRSLVADAGKVYISMYNGYVSRLDTLTLAIDKTLKVGPNPEVMAIRGDCLYVPNSDGLNWQNGYGTTASKINLKTFTVEKTITVPLNPTQFVSNGSDLFLLSMGNYYDIASKIYRIDADDNASEIAEATLMAIKDNKLYYINAPYTANEFTYSIYDINNGSISSMLSDSGVDSPAAIGVDPTTGSIVITSYSLDNGWASYTTDGYAKIYDAKGTALHQFSVGVGPCAIAFY